MFIVDSLLSCVFWGTILALIIIVAFYVLCRKKRPLHTRRTMFFFELGLLFFILGYQTFLIVGAIYVKGHINEMHEGVNNIVLKTSNHANKTINDIEDTMQKNNKKFPFFLLLKQIGIEEEICHMEEYGHSTIDVVADYLHNTINYYILRRIIWIIGFSGMTLGIIFLFDRRKQILTPHNDFNTNCIDEYDNNFDNI